MSYVDVEKLHLGDCPCCGRNAVIVAKGCFERQYRIYCEGMQDKPAPTCSRQTSWVHSPEIAVQFWKAKEENKVVTGFKSLRTALAERGVKLAAQIGATGGQTLKHSV